MLKLFPCLCFLSLLEKFLQRRLVVHIGWRQTFLIRFVIALFVVEFDELRHGRPQSLRAGEHQQIQPSFERLVNRSSLPLV